MTRRHKIASCVVLGILAVLWTGSEACNPGIIESNWTLEEARRFDEFTLFWLGEEHEGLPLTVTYRSQTSAQNIVRLVYGEPTLTKEAWTAPLDVLVQPYCDSSPERTRARWAWYSDVGGGSFDDIEVRGVPGILFGDESDGSVYVWTADYVVEIQGIAPLRAAEALIPIVENSGATLKPLPPPISTSC